MLTEGGDRVGGAAQLVADGGDVAAGDFVARAQEQEDREEGAAEEGGAGQGGEEPQAEADAAFAHEKSLFSSE